MVPVRGIGVNVRFDLEAVSLPAISVPAIFHWLI